MEAQRATDNIQQKASDCLGTVNEWTFEPVFLGPRPNHLEASFTDPDLMVKIAEWKRSKTTVVFHNPYYDYLRCNPDFQKDLEDFFK